MNGLKRDIYGSKWQLFIHSSSFTFIAEISFFIINIALLPIGLDRANLNSFIYGGNLVLVGLNPYRVSYGMAMGFPSMLYWLLPAFLYDFFQYNLLAGLIGFKLIGVFSYFLIYLQMKNYCKNTLKTSSLPIIYLLNPLFFFFNDIQMVDDFFPLLLLVLGFVLYRRGALEGRNSRTLIGIIYMTISFLMYYFPILLLPSLFIYTTNRKKDAFFFTSLSIILVPMLVLKLFSNFALHVVTAPQTNVIGSPFSLFNIIPMSLISHVPTLSFSISIFVIIISFLVPLIFKVKGVPLEFSIALVFSIALSVELSGPTPDLYIFVVTFIAIGILFSVEPDRYKGVFLYFNLALIPLIIIQEFVWGLGGYTGIFYWLENFFPNYADFITFQYFSSISKILILFSFLSFIFIFKKIATIKSSPKNVNVLPLIIKSSNNSKKKIYAMIIMLLIIGGGCITATVYHNSQRETFPIMNFSVVGPQNTFVFPSKTTYQISGKEIAFYSYSKIMYISRNIKEQSVHFNTTFSSVDQNRYNSFMNDVTFIKIGNTNFSYLSFPNLNGFNSNTLTPAITVNLSNATVPHQNPFLPINNIKLPYYNISNSSIIGYDLNKTDFHNKTLFYLFHINYVVSPQTILFVFRTSSTIYQSIILNGKFITSYTNGSLWYSQSSQWYNDSYWNTVTLSIYRDNISLQLDQHNLLLPLFNHTKFTVTMGAWANNRQFFGNNSFDGIVSNALLLKNNYLNYSKEIMISNSSSDRNTIIIPFAASPLPISINATQNNITYNIGNISGQIHRIGSSLEIGKITPSQLNLYFANSEFYFDNYVGNSVVKAFRAALYALPFEVLMISKLAERRKRKQYSNSNFLRPYL